MLYPRVLLPGAANSPMRSRVAEIAPAEGNEEIESAAPGSRRAEARLRDSELFLLVLALCAGVAAGLGVIITDACSDWSGTAAFGLSRPGAI